jgi:hypothetical protein
MGVEICLFGALELRYLSVRTEESLAWAQFDFFLNFSLLNIVHSFLQPQAHSSQAWYHGPSSACAF